jgi:sigma-54 specific flagellar transcriptional regulator A
VPAPDLIHGPRSPLVQIARTCERIAASESTVLITGETGVGKEIFAHLIHAGSSRAAKALVIVNCAAIPGALFESELFGYKKGAFTDARRDKLGRIAGAEGGTLFLDEIGELPSELQVKMLRVLQERSYEPIGATTSVSADFRLVVATNKDLAAEVEAGRFRRDLYYRLYVCPLEIPPLRRRSGDVTPLFEHFWSKRGETRPIDQAS